MGLLAGFLSRTAATPFTIAMIPLHAALILTGAKSFDTPLIGSERLNRRGLHVWRLRLSHRIASLRRSRIAHLAEHADRLAFESQGYVEKRNLLDPGAHAELVSQLRNLSAPAREMTEGSTITRRIAITPDVLRQAPALASLLSRPEWTGLTRYVGGFHAEPLVCIQTIFSGATAARTGDPQTRLHMDTFHPTMKAWYFVEGVPADRGPFSYVPGSHRLTSRRAAWHKRRSVAACRNGAKGGAFSVSEMELRQLRYSPRRAFSVPGNTLVVADTFGLHARMPSTAPSVRVEIYASMRPNPFNPFVFLDTALIPFVRGRKMQIGWRIEDALVRLGLARRKWREVGRVDPWTRTPSV